MNYRLTVKGQVAVVALLLLIVAAFVILKQTAPNPIASEPSKELQSEAPASEAPTVAATDSVTAPQGAEEPVEKVHIDALEGVRAVVYFKPDRWEIAAAEIGKITEIAAMMEDYPDETIVIEGNINKVSEEADDEFAKELSLKRAQVVLEVFAVKGIDKSRVRIVSNGSGKPATSNRDEAWKNRRSEIYFEGYDKVISD